MANYLTSVLIYLLVVVLTWSLVFAQPASEPKLGAEPTPASPPPSAPMSARPAFTQQELDQMLAPIALYPDQLLSHILTAATYPLEVIEAARWLQMSALRGWSGAGSGVLLAPAAGGPELAQR